MSPIAYKVLTGAEMAAFQLDGVFLGSPADLADGFIHLSTEEQLDGTLRKHFLGQNDLVIVTVNLADLDAQLRWEPSRGGTLFPHIYGALPIAAVLSHCDLAIGADGTTALPK
jgi:uncharacterized protein (DUF952 family)